VISLNLVLLRFILQAEERRTSFNEIISFFRLALSIEIVYSLFVWSLLISNGMWFIFSFRPLNLTLMLSKVLGISVWEIDTQIWVNKYSYSLLPGKFIVCLDKMPFLRYNVSPFAVINWHWFILSS